MAKTHRTAMGKFIDMDMIRLANETSIAIGNMKTNARGDELGQGGKIVKSRAQIMQEYYALNTPVADNTPLDTIPSPAPVIVPTIQEEIPNIVPEDQKDLTDDYVEEPAYVKPRGSLADTVAQSTEVNQTLLDPINKRNGLQRI